MIEFKFKGKVYHYHTEGYKVTTIFTNIVSLVTDTDVHTAAQEHHAERRQEQADIQREGER